VFQYQAQEKDDSPVIEALQAHSQQHPREGSRKAGAALRRAGTRVNHKKVERLWRQQGLTVPVKRRQRRRGKGLDRPLTPLYPNHVWAYDFVEDACVGGRKLRILTVVEEFTRESLETYVDYSIPAAKVIEILQFLFLLHGGPEYLRRDNGPDARWTIENYRRYFNEERLHGALDYVPPAEFKQQWLAAHPTAPGALPPDPRDLPLPASKQKQDTESRTGPRGGPASAPMVGQRSGCVPAEPYPLADHSRIIERQRKARDSEKIIVEVGNPNP
jgi:hypothetical protein